MIDRFELPHLDESDGTVEQLAQRRAAHAIAYEVQRLEDDERVTGWERLNRPKAFEVAGHLRRIATELFTAGTRGLEMKVAYETARMRGFPCSKCGHRHEGGRFQFRCFQCHCAERSEPTPATSGDNVTRFRAAQVGVQTGVQLEGDPKPGKP